MMSDQCLNFNLNKNRDKCLLNPLFKLSRELCCHKRDQKPYKIIIGIQY